MAAPPPIARAAVLEAGDEHAAVEATIEKAFEAAAARVAALAELVGVAVSVCWVRESGRRRGEEGRRGGGAGAAASVGR
jgi:hypothetical protein